VVSSLSLVQLHTIVTCTMANRLVWGYVLPSPYPIPCLCRAVVMPWVGRLTDCPYDSDVQIMLSDYINGMPV